jgi:Zn-finger nucleic acid-binding protein
MDCAWCEGTLHPVELEGIQLDMCDTCDGIWFERDELLKVVEAEKSELMNTVLNEAWVNEPEEIDPTDGQKYSCPVCNEPLHRYQYHLKSGIEIDACDHGHGLWIDDGESQKIYLYLIEANKQISEQQRSELRTRLQQLHLDFKGREQELMDSLVKHDDMLSPLALPAHLLQLVYSLFYKLGI